MPIQRRTLTTAGTIYGRPFVGIAEYPAQIAVNFAVLTAFEVDADGYLKPGVMFTRAGALIGIAPAFCYGVVPEPIKYAVDNVAATLTAVGVQQVTVITIGQVNRAIIEDNLGRVLTANEIAGCDAAGSRIVLQY